MSRETGQRPKWHMNAAHMVEEHGWTRTGTAGCRPPDIGDRTLELSPDAVPDGWTQITIYDEQTGDRIATVFDEAYAALFKAAPDLLSALAELLDDTQWEFEQDCKNLDDEEVLAHVRAIRERAEAAVAKARGE